MGVLPEEEKAAFAAEVVQLRAAVDASEVAWKEDCGGDECEEEEEEEEEAAKDVEE